MGNFQGFSPETFAFLRDIGNNNNKPWFEVNKTKYQTFVVTPLQALVADLSGFMLGIDPRFVTTPAVGKTISRIYRDTRFSKDKSLYRNNMWLTFKRPIKEWMEAPAYYFEISPEGCSFGMGFYNASRSTMDAFRKMIDEEPDRFLDAVAFRGNGPFRLEGERYKKLLAPDKPEPIGDWYNMKSFYLVGTHQLDEGLFRQGLADELMDGFATLAPLYEFIWESKTRFDEPKPDQFRR